MAQKISVEVDVNTKEVKFAGGEVTRLAQQVRVLTEELNRMQAAGQVGSEKYQILVEKLNDTKDAMDRTKLASQEIYGTLSAIPGPIGEISSKLNTTIDSFKLLGSLKTTELRTQFVGLLKDVKEAGAGILNFIGYNKVYEKVLTTLSAAERQKIAAQKASIAAQEGVTKATQASNAANQALANTTTSTAAATASQGTASTVTTGAITAQTVATGGATIATRIFAAALAALPFVGLAIAISAAVSALTSWISGTEEAEQAQRDLNRELENQDRLLDKTLKQNDVIETSERKNALAKKGRRLTDNEDFLLRMDALKRDEKATREHYVKISKAYDDNVKKYGENAESLKAIVAEKQETITKLEDLKIAKDQLIADDLLKREEKRIDQKEQTEKKAQEKAEERRKKAQDQRLKDLDELQKAQLDAFKVTLSEQEKEEYEVNLKYVKLQALAVQYGKDTKDLKQAQEIELAKIRKKYSDQELKDKEEAQKKLDDKQKQQYDTQRNLAEQESEVNIELIQKESDRRIAILDRESKKKEDKYKQDLLTARSLGLMDMDEVESKLMAFREKLKKANEVAKNEILNDDAIKSLQEKLKLLQLQAEGLVEGTRSYFNNRREILNTAEQEEYAALQRQVLTYEEAEKRKEAIKKKYAKQRAELSKEEFNQVLQYVVQGFEAFKSVADAQLAVLDANRTVELENAKATIKDKEKLAVEQDKINEKYFYKQKGAQKAQAYISTFQAAVSAYAAMAAIPVVGPVLGAIAAAAAIVAGLANVKKIDATTYTSTISDTGSSNANAGVGTKFAKGGLLSGPSHAQGGIKTRFGELEGGEYVVNKRSTQSFMPLLSAINSVGNRKYANGGMMPTMDSIKELMAAQQMPIVKTYVVASEMTSQQEANKKLQDLAKI